ncbi:uncharacterized protein LOC142170506 [Nicotiana tabacum]|uniref:Uncharacterized protein LOC142170506 n=1 Tax=Nicotiana tabacum TaxID=4097 RepID=A0AC58SU89_TOBAC
MQTLKVGDIRVKDPPPAVVMNEREEENPNSKFLEREERDVLIRSWLTGTMTEESMFLIIGCTSAKQIWQSFEDNYLQASKDKEFQLKQQIQSIKMGSKTVDEYIKEFKGICDSLTAIHKPLDEDSKVINFAKGLGNKCKTLRTVMLGKPPYPTFPQFVNALRGYDMREEDSEKDHVDHAMAFQAQKTQGSFGQGRGNSFRGRGQSRGRGQYGPKFNNYRPGRQSSFPTNNQKSFSSQTNPCQICGRNNHTAVSCFYRWDYSYQSQQETPQGLSALTINEPSDNNLYMDSGATHHMVHTTGNLNNSTLFKGSDLVMVGDGKLLKITHVGNKEIGTNLKLKDVLVVPKLKKNLLSVSKLASDNACLLEFTDCDFVLKDKKTRNLLPKGSRKGDLYALDSNKADGEVHRTLAAIRSNKASHEVWHQRLEHPNSRTMKFLHSNRLVRFSSWNKNFSICTACQMGKSCKQPFENSNKIEIEPLIKVHCDLWGPSCYGRGNGGFISNGLYGTTPGFQDPTSPNHVCLLQRAIYGLKQAPKAWFQWFSEALLQLGFKGSHADSSLFVLRNNTTIIILLLYVDDIVITGNNPVLLHSLISQLSSQFALKNMGNRHFFLGIEVIPYREGLYLSQTKYAQDGVKRILRYQAGTVNFGLRITSRSSLQVVGFSDADWAGANCISWSSKKQHTVAKSSAEAEYRALAALAADVTWIVHLLHHVGVLLASPPVLYSDNISALHLSSNPILYARTKHVELDYHFIREKVTSGAMVTKYVPSLNQVADIFTKALTKQQYQFLRSKLGVVSLPTSSLRGMKVS